MSALLNITGVNVMTAVRSFLLTILPAGIEVVRGQGNRVPEPYGADFLVITPISRERMGTNIVTCTDVSFTGSISADTLTITAMWPHGGSVGVNSVILGPGVAYGTTVTAPGTGTGGIGTYTISPAPQTVASTKLAAGTRQDMQTTLVTVQVDIHGPCSSDNLQIITTLFRSERGVEIFKNSGFDITPLFPSEPIQLPFINEGQQFEERWTVDLALQVNFITTVPQQFADQLQATPVSVFASYSP